MAVNLIDSDKKLEEMISFLGNSPKIAYDTEFFRKWSLFPKIGLLQFEANGEIFLVDPFAVESIEELTNHLCETDSLIVTHAYGEDFEIISDTRHYGQNCVKKRYFRNPRELNKYQTFAPRNVFDTQVAAKFLFRESKLSLVAVLEEHMGIVLDKAETTSDWLQRPLTESQLEYASLDVAYLVELSEILDKKIKAKGVVYDYFHEELSEISKKFNNPNQLDDVYLNIKFSGKLSPERFRMLRALVELRNRACLSQDLPTVRFLDNNGMISLVKKNILELKNFNDVRISNIIAKNWGNVIKTTLLKAYYSKEKVVYTYDYVIQNSEWKEKIDALKAYLEEVSIKLQINKDYLYTNKLVAQFFYYHYIDDFCGLPLLESGWRRDAVGDLSRFL